MPKFKISGVGTKTGRKRNKVYAAYDKEEAISKAVSDETKVKTCEELPPEMPTEKQIEYAKNVGIKVSKHTTKDEISDLLTNYEEEDQPADEITRKLADAYRVSITRYTGNQSILNQISYRISKSGDEKEYVTWFLYNVAFNLGLDNRHDLFVTLESVTEEFMQNPKAMSSLKNRHSDGRGIANIRFTQSDENHTESFKFARELLKQKYGIKKGKFKERPSQEYDRNPQQLSRFQRMNNLSGLEQFVIALGTVFLIIYLIF